MKVDSQNKSKIALFRWKGLVVFIAILVAAYFSVPVVIKAVIESSLEAAFDAKASVNKVKVDYANATLSIHQLTVADSELPMQNLFEFSEATLSGNIFAALTGRFIIDEMSVKGVQFETIRRESGLLVKPAKDTTQVTGEEAISDNEFASVSTMPALPDADELLAREPLKTAQLSEQLQQYLEHQDQLWKVQEENLPTKDSLDEYKTKFKTLQNTKIKTLSDFKKAEKQFKKLKKAVKNDQRKLKQAQEFLSETSKYSQSLLIQLKDAPKQDLKHLKSKYTLSDNGALNITGLLLGGEVQKYADRGLSIYKRVKPILIDSTEDESNEPVKQRLKGHLVHFGNTKPSFWIKVLSVTGEYNNQSFSAKLTDITHQPYIINKPMVISLQSDSTDSAQRIHLDGLLDYRSEKKAIEKLQLKISAMPIEQWRIIKDKQMTIEMAQATLSASASLQRVSGVPSGVGNAHYTSVKFNNEGHNSFSREMAAAIAKVDRFDVEASFEKSVDNLRLSSDLDNKISKAINARLKAKQDELEQELKFAVQDELNKALEKNKLDSFINAEQGLDKQLADIENLLKQELDSYEDQEKAKQKKKADKALDKEQDKLKDKLKSLF